MKNWMTKLQINAIIALVILGAITWRLIDVIRINNLETHEIQIIGAALMAGVGGIVFVVKLFASDNESNGGSDSSDGDSGGE